MDKPTSRSLEVGSVPKKVARNKFRGYQIEALKKVDSKKFPRGHVRSLLIKIRLTLRSRCKI